MSFFNPNYYRPSNGKRLTVFARYTEILERDIKKFLLVNLVTLVSFLPFILGVTLSILSSSVLILIPSCLIGGIFAGPALSCIYDAVMRSLRDASKNWWKDYKHAWKQNWRQSILPGILFCLMLGFYIFMVNPLCRLWNHCHIHMQSVSVYHVFFYSLATDCFI